MVTHCGDVEQAGGGFRTFDVFDTVLTRSVGDFRALFLHLGARMRDEGLTTCEPAVVAAVRAQAEQWLPTRLGRGPRLIEIHEEITRALGLADGTAKRSADLELDIERAVSEVVPGASERVADARRHSSGGRVGFVSDTPLPADALVAMLTRAELWRPGDLCFSSADAGVDKHSGRLFPVVVKEIGCAPGDILHTGDNSWNDVAMARLNGLQAVPTTGAVLNRYEKALAAASGATGGLTSWISGASRMARLTGARHGTDRAVAAVAAGVFAPTMIGFSLWLVQQVRRRELRRLYFCSRDGQLPMRVAQPILARLAPEVECRYLYGSRSAWHVAGCGLDPDRHFGEWITNELDTEVTVRMLLGRAHVTVEEAHERSGLELFAAVHLDRVLTVSERNQVIQDLEHGALAVIVGERTHEGRDLLVDYLRQEGFADGVPSAVVDIGWKGRTSRTLDDVIVAAGLTEPLAYLYLGLNEGSDRFSGPRVAARHDAWLYDHDAGHGVAHPLPTGSTLLLETMCSGTEGGTVGFRRAGDRVEPVLLAPANERALDWGLDEVHDVVLDVARRVAENSPMHPEVDLRAACMAVLRAFWEQPTQGEVSAWATFPYDQTGQEDGDQPIAEPVATTFVLGQLRAGHLRFRPVASWLAGTTKLSPPHWRVVMSVRTAYHRHSPRLRRIPRRVQVEWYRRRG